MPDLTRSLQRQIKKQMGGSSHAVYMSNTESIQENNPEIKQEIRFESKGKVRISLFSSPIEDDILQEMGFEPGLELEKLIHRYS